MTNPHIEAIREACIKANPEIIELKFGCKVKKGNWTGYIYSLMINKDGPYQFNFITKTPEGLRPIHVDMNLESYEILGREIRLADILLAFGAKETDTGLFREEIIQGQNCWDLYHDSLDQQSLRCIEFINSLIK